MAGDLAHDRRQPQPLEVGDRGVHSPRHQAQAAALFEQINAEPGFIAVRFENDVGEIDTAGVLQNVLLANTEQRKHQPFHLGSRERWKLHQAQHSGKPHGRGHPDFEVQVRALESHHHPEELVRFGLIRHRVNSCFNGGRHGVALLCLRGL